MNSIEFKKLLDSSIVPSSDTINLDKYQTILEYISANKPSKLYRYRTCCERNFDAFYNDQIWVSTPDCMNDGFDTRLYFDKQYVEDSLDRWLENELVPQIRDISQRKMKVPENMSDLRGILNAVDFLQNLPEDQLESAIRKYVSFVKENIYSLFSTLPSITQKAVHIACFSEDITSSVMWGLYGADESGFALEYEFPKASFSLNNASLFQRDCTLYPVIYGDERFTVPEEYIRFLVDYRMWELVFYHAQGMKDIQDVAERILHSLKCPDLFIPTKIALHKSSGWKYEKEWRVFCSSKIDTAFNNSQHGFYIQKPTGIFLGRRVSSFSEKVLKDLAVEKELPVYKMYLDDNSPSYELKYMQIL